MLNWFKRKTVEQTTATDDMMLGDYPGHVPPRPLLSPTRDSTYDDSLYTIGCNNAGMVQLRLNGNGYGATTLTMNKTAVRSMIRQLEAALPEEDSE